MGGVSDDGVSLHRPRGHRLDDPPGLPADFPDGGEAHGPVAGLTFPPGGGEVRVLPRAAFPRRASADLPVAPLGARSRVRGLESADWEDLLRQAVVWPPA